MFKNNKKICLGYVLSSILFLTACGGSDTKSDITNNTTSSTVSNTPIASNTSQNASTPINNAPEILLTTSSIIINEGSEKSFDITVTDEETVVDELLITVTPSNAEVLTVSYDTGTISLVVSEVEEDTNVIITISVTDDDNTTVTSLVFVSVLNIPTSYTSVSMESTAEISINNTLKIPYSVTYLDGVSFQEHIVTVSDESVFTTSLSDDYIIVTGISAGTASFTYNITDSNNKAVSHIVIVTVIDTPSGVTIGEVTELGTNNSKLIEYSVDFEINSEEVTSSDNDILSVTLVENKIKLIGQSEGQATFTYAVTSITGLVYEITQLVTVIPGKTPVTISLGGTHLNGGGIIYGEEINEYPIFISSLYDAERIVSITSVGTPSYSDALRDFDFDIKIEDDSLIINAPKPPVNRVIDFDIEITITDKYHTVSKVFTLLFISRPNSEPFFAVKGQLSGYIPIPQGITKTFSYEIVDDNPDNIVFTVANLWYGDNDLIEYSLDSKAKTITITNPSNMPIEDTFGIQFHYEDGLLSGYFLVEVISSVALESLQKETLDSIQIYYNQLAGLKEYFYIAEFYGEFLESLNLLTDEEVVGFTKRVKTSESESYNLVTLWPSNLETFVVHGTWQDPDIIESYKSGINTQMDLAILEYSAETFKYVNELAALSDGVLPILPFEPTLNEYDTINHKYSRFAGNVTYGDYVNGTWVFKNEYKFMNAIINKSAAQTKRVYEH